MRKRLRFTSSPLHPFRTLWKRRGHRFRLRDPRMTTASSQFEVREVFTKPRPFSREPSAVSTFHPEFLKDSEFFSPLSGTGWPAKVGKLGVLFRKTVCFKNSYSWSFSSPPESLGQSRLERRSVRFPTKSFWPDDALMGKTSFYKSTWARSDGAMKCSHDESSIGCIAYSYNYI